MNLYDKIYLEDRQRICQFISSLKGKFNRSTILDNEDILSEIFLNFTDEDYSIDGVFKFINKLFDKSAPSGATSIELIPQYKAFKKNIVFDNQKSCSSCYKPFDISQFYKGQLMCKACKINKQLSIYHESANPKNKYKRVVKMIKGDQIVIFPSKQQASRETGIHQTNISRVLLGKAKTTGGALWAYV